MVNQHNAPKAKSRKRAFITEKPPLSCAVYDGRMRIGNVREIGKSSFEAADLTGRVVGCFRTPKAASASLSGGGVE